MPDREAVKARIVAMIDDLMEEARKQGMAEATDNLVQMLMSGRKRGPGRPPKNATTSSNVGGAQKPGKKRKNSWSGLSAEQRLARVNAIRKGKGLPPRDK